MKNMENDKESDSVADMSIYIGSIITLVLWNMITFMLMGVDKHKAQSGKRRISERTLFLSAFIFGGTGVLCGMYAFRHKTKHWSFKILVPIAVVINLFLCYYIFIQK